MVPNSTRPITTMNSAPITIEAKPKVSRTARGKSSPSRARAIARNRMIAYMPVFSSAADSIALAGLGASACASGSQVCIGASPTLVP